MPYQHSSESNNHAIPNVVGFASDSNASLHRCALRSPAPRFVYRNRRSHDGRYSTSADQRSSLTTWPLLQQFFTQRRVPSFGRQSLERHVDRHSICTETRCPKEFNHSPLRNQAPGAKRQTLRTLLSVHCCRFEVHASPIQIHWILVSDMHKRAS